jgi:hypothetical protein
MGNNHSSTQDIKYTKNEILIDDAFNRFKYRVYAYNYEEHGPLHKYIEWCQSQYERECLILEKYPDKYRQQMIER